MEIDEEKVLELAMALMVLHAFKKGPSTVAWKTLDWDISSALHKRGWIHDPVGKSKSITFTEDGLAQAEQFKKKYLSKSR